MPKVYTTVPGLELRIDGYGVATEEVPVEVPDEVAAELKKHPQLRIVLDVDGERLAKAVEKSGVVPAPRRASSAPAKAEKKEKEG